METAIPSAFPSGSASPSPVARDEDGADSTPGGRPGGSVDSRAYDFRTPMPAGVDDELGARIDAIAPVPPQWLNQGDEEAVARWEMCARLAALVAVKLGDGLGENEQRTFAWHSARAYFRDPNMVMDEPTPAAA